MIKKAATALMLASLASLPLSAKVQVNHLGTTNTMVRVTGPERYLILPVQESMPDAKVDIIVDGRVMETIYVRLAAGDVDYTVPLDLSPFMQPGGSVLLNIVSETDRSHNRDVTDYICWEEMTQASTFDVTNRERYRPAFHHTPIYGWMNDPNGMFYKDGVWHLYYQYNPYGSKWQNMSWGHSTSTDLIHWQHHPVVLRPDGLGSIFSGSAAVIPGDTIVALYTSAGESQVQSMAYSTDDGMTFTTYPDNPVILNPREARDPNFFFHEPTGRWVLVLADALEQQMQIYTSTDLKDWTYQSSFGKGYGSQFGVWECPDLFELPVEGTNKTKWVLLCNINPGAPFGGSGTQYFVGDFDGTTFTCNSRASLSKWMDYGKDNYATVSWSGAPDGRRTVIGWMSNWQYAAEVPTMQFRSANTLPRDLALFCEDGEYYLKVTPSPEVNALRLSPITHAAATVGTEPLTYNLPKENDGVCEILIDYSARGCSRLDFTLSNDSGEEVVFTLDPSRREIAMDRTHSGLTRFSRQFPAVTIAPTHNSKATGTLRIFVDRSSIEAFDADGRFAMTNLVFPTAPYNRLTVSAQGGRAKISSVNIFPINIQ